MFCTLLVTSFITSKYLISSCRRFKNEKPRLSFFYSFTWIRSISNKLLRFSYMAPGYRTIILLTGMWSKEKKKLMKWIYNTFPEERLNNIYRCRAQFAMIITSSIIFLFKKKKKYEIFFSHLECGIGTSWRIHFLSFLFKGYTSRSIFLPWIEWGYW